MEEKIRKELATEIKGHPSREEHQRITRLEDIVIELAKEIDNLKSQE